MYNIAETEHESAAPSVREGEMPLSRDRRLPYVSACIDIDVCTTRNVRTDDAFPHSVFSWQTAQGHTKACACVVDLSAYLSIEAVAVDADDVTSSDHSSVRTQSQHSVTPDNLLSCFFFKQKTAYEITV